MKVTPDGGRILIGTEKNGVIVYDVAKHDTVAALTRENGVRQIEFSDDGSFFAMATSKDG